MKLQVAIAQANCGKSKEATKFCIDTMKEYQHWAVIMNEPGFLSDVLPSEQPDVHVHWGLHSANLIIISNMNNWEIHYASEEMDVIIIKNQLLKDTWYLCGCYFNPKLSNSQVKKQMATIHEKLYLVKSCRLIIGGDMNSKCSL